MHTEHTLLHIIATTPDYLIIYKPAGLMVHGDGRSRETTLTDQILVHYPELGGVGEDWIRSTDERVIDVKNEPVDDDTRGGELVIQRPGIVHRLDRDTSGLMIIARTQEFFDYIKNEFQEHRIRKIYRAYVYGWVKDDEGSIDAAIGKSRTDFRKWSAQRGARGAMRPALTDYRVLHRFQTGPHTEGAEQNIGGKDNKEKKEAERYTLIEFRPKTGRTHQIRVHAKYMNHPVVADALYAGKLAETSSNLGFTRHALHAQAITFYDREGKEQSYEAPLPEDFLRVG